MSLEILYQNGLKFLIVFSAVVVSGYAASTGNPVFLVLALGALVGTIVALDYRLLMIVTLFGGVVVSGLAQLYAPSIELIRWAFSASATLLLVHVLVESIKSNTLRLRVDSSVMFWVLIFVLVLLCSATLQNVKLSVALISMKGYLQVWGAYFALALLPWTSEQMKKLPAFLLGITLIQAPFVLHQYFVLVPLRVRFTGVDGMVPIDIVAGTLGGQINHGGANAALTLLCFMTASGLLSLWKNHQLTTWKFLPLIILVAFPAFINSTKISVFYLLATLFIIYYDEIHINPIKFMGRLFATLALCLVLAFSVISSLPESAKVESLSDLYEQTYNYNVAEDSIRDYNLSRSGTIKAWLNPVKPHRFKDIVIGYGIGSSRIIESDGGRRISNNINIERPTGVTALAALIWETGIVGVLAVIMLFFIALSVATKLKRAYKNDGFHRSIFTAMQCAVVIMFISLAHKSFFTFHIGFQTLFVILFGYLTYWERREARGLD